MDGYLARGTWCNHDATDSNHSRCVYVGGVRVYGVGVYMCVTQACEHDEFYKGYFNETWEDGWG